MNQKLRYLSLGPLVATEFVPKPILGPGSMETEAARLFVRHSDGDKENNTANNLLWATSRECCLMHHRTPGRVARTAVW